jgi:hypothetical protein
MPSNKKKSSNPTNSRRNQKIAVKTVKKELRKEVRKVEKEHHPRRKEIDPYASVCELPTVGNSGP